MNKAKYTVVKYGGFTYHYMNNPDLDSGPAPILETYILIPCGDGTFDKIQLTTKDEDKDV